MIERPQAGTKMLQLLFLIGAGAGLENPQIADMINQLQRPRVDPHDALKIYNALPDDLKKDPKGIPVTIMLNILQRPDIFPDNALNIYKVLPDNLKKDPEGIPVRIMLNILQRPRVDPHDALNIYNALPADLKSDPESILIGAMLNILQRPDIFPNNVFKIYNALPDTLKKDPEGIPVRIMLNILQRPRIAPRDALNIYNALPADLKNKQGPQQIMCNILGRENIHADNALNIYRILTEDMKRRANAAMLNIMENRSNPQEAGEIFHAITGYLTEEQRAQGLEILRRRGAAPALQRFVPGRAFEIHSYARAPVEICGRQLSLLDSAYAKIEEQVGANGIPVETYEQTLREISTMIPEGQFRTLLRGMNHADDQRSLAVIWAWVKWQAQENPEITRLWLQQWLQESQQAYSSALSESCAKGITERMTTAARGINPEVDALFKGPESALSMRTIITNLNPLIPGASGKNILNPALVRRLRDLGAIDIEDAKPKLKAWLLKTAEEYGVLEEFSGEIDNILEALDYLSGAQYAELNTLLA